MNRLQDKFVLSSQPGIVLGLIKLIKSIYSSVGCNITVNEHWWKFKKHCKFIQYMVNKPDKFSLTGS